MLKYQHKKYIHLKYPFPSLCPTRWQRSRTGVQRALTVLHTYFGTTGPRTFTELALKEWWADFQRTRRQHTHAHFHTKDHLSGGFCARLQALFLCSPGLCVSHAASMSKAPLWRQLEVAGICMTKASCSFRGGAVNMEVNSPRVGDILSGLLPGQLRTRPQLRASSLVQTALAFFQKKPIRRRGFFRNRFVLCYSNRRIRRLGCICCRMESLMNQTPQFDSYFGFVWG